MYSFHYGREFGDWTDEDSVYHSSPDRYTGIRRQARRERKLPWKERVDSYFRNLKEQEAQKLLRERERLQEEKEEGDQSPLSLRRSYWRSFLSEPYRGFDSYEAMHAHDYRQTRIGKEFHGFQHLPLNVRYLIYEYALIRRKVFVRNNSKKGAYGEFEMELNTYGYMDYSGETRLRFRDMMDYTKKGRAPRTAAGLLRGVSKAIQAEAEHIFWSAKNQFIFPSGPFDYPAGFYCGDLIGCGPTTLKPARNISFAFDMLDYGYVSPALLRGDAMDNMSDEELENATPQDFRNAVHEIQQSSIESTWQCRLELINEQLQLQKLQIDLEQCFCPVGCCRMVEFACGLVGPFTKGPPACLEILGHEEKEMARILELLTSHGVPAKAILFLDPLPIDT